MNTSVTIDQLAAQFDQQEADPETRSTFAYGELLMEIRQHGRFRFRQYQPALYAAPTFEERLHSWLFNECLNDEDRKVLIQLLPQVQFIDRDEEAALHRAAFRGPVARWLTDQFHLDIFAQDYRRHFFAACQRTWFCPLTDSMNIGLFHHLNQLPGHSLRPTLRDLVKLAAPSGKSRRAVRRLLLEHIRIKKFERLVVLEDFVGTGKQAAEAIEFLCLELRAAVPMLFVPLLITPSGEKRLRDVEGKFEGDLSVIPVSVIPQGEFVPSMVKRGERVPDSVVVRRLVRKIGNRACFVGSPFGFGGTGGLLVQYSNCPNTTLRPLWTETPKWTPLFPRVNRE